MDAIEKGLTPKALYYTYCNIMKGKELRAARARLGMTQTELGEALGVHWNSIARMERDYDSFPITRTTELAVKYLLVMKSKRKGSKKK
jgi:DNA-binding XRE family transcriptional regulator